MHGFRKLKMSELDVGDPLAPPVNGVYSGSSALSLLIHGGKYV